MYRVSFHTLGCKVNQAETAMLAESFRQRGFDVVPFGDEADVVFINTCTVTGKTDYCSRQAVRRALRDSPRAYIVVGGCYAELAWSKLSELEGVDLILGADTKFDVLEHLDGLHKRTEAKVCLADLPNRKFLAPVAGDFRPRTRAFLKIQDGCDFHCSYCTVPLARGRSRSAAPEDIVSRGKALAERGYKELVLTGVHIGRYGSDFPDPWNLHRLLKLLLQSIPQVRFRLSSLEPQEVKDDLLEVIASSDRICGYFHIPMQSGADSVLAAMNRTYNSMEFREKIEKIVERFSDVGLGTDVIVGFPGETEGEFDKTYRLVKDLPFTYLHVFRYSARPGTKADELEDNVPPPIKAERSEILRYLGSVKKHNFASSFIGRELSVLFEQHNDDQSATGLASNYLRVETQSSESLTNTLRRVRISAKNSKGNLVGVLVN